MTSSSRGQGCILPRRPGGKVPPNHQLALQAGRQTIALGQSGREMLVVRAIPAADVAVVVGIALVVAAVAMILVVAVSFAVVAIMVVTVMAALVIVIAIVLSWPCPWSCATAMVVESASDRTAMDAGAEPAF